MNEMTKLLSLQEENERLKSDNEMLRSTVAQMKVTLNRLITHYISEENFRKRV